jgi:hypothetical protein
MANPITEQFSKYPSVRDILMGCIAMLLTIGIGIMLRAYHDTLTISQ